MSPYLIIMNVVAAAFFAAGAMADNEIHGKNWYKEVKSPKDSVPYDRRLDFYLKRAERKAGLTHLSKDFDVTIKSQIERGVFKSLEDLKKVSKKEYKIKEK